MNIDIILSSLGWALLHSIWQGFLAAGLVLGFRAFAKSASANLRYTVQFFGLFLCFAAFIVTFTLYAVASGNGADAVAVTTSFTEIIQLGKITFAPAADPATVVNYNEILNHSSPLLGAAWVLGFVIISLRCTLSYKLTQTLRKTGLSAAPSEWEMRFKMLARQAGLPRMAQIYVSNRVSGPLTLGFFKPIVLVPASFFTQLPKDQVEAILLHEIAHIRRHDYLLNILQTAIKAVLFYHPGVHYISRKINDDREYACDDFSVSETRNPKALAMALASLRLSHPRNSFAMAANGKTSPLMIRLQRLVKTAPVRRERGQAAVPAIALLLSTAIYFSMAPLSEAHPEPETTDSYTHAKHKLENYSFDVIQHEGRPVTVKVTEDGRRWVLVNGAWHDIQQRPEMLRAVPVMPVAPVPPVPPVNIFNNGDEADMKDFEKSMRKYEKSMDQFNIDMDYFGKSMEQWGETFGEDFAQQFAPEFEEQFVEQFAETFSNSFDENFGGVARDMEGEDHPHSSDKAQAKAEAMRAKIMARAEARSHEHSQEQREAALERAEEQRERLEDQRERMEDQREAMLERAADRREAALERAEEQREAAMERAEEQREAAMERAEEQRERAMERAERNREKSQEKHAKYNTLRSELYSHLQNDGIVSSPDEAVTIQYKDGTWVANGTRISKSKKEKYCETIADAGIEKHGTTISLSPRSTHVTTQSGKNNKSHSITIGEHEHRTEERTKSKTKTKPWKEGMNLNFVQPVRGAKISAPYGKSNSVGSKSHQGVDLSADEGTPVYASADGTVHIVTTEPAWGHRVIVKHKDGFQTVYANLEGFNVKRGQTVKAGQTIGQVGSTARDSSCPHLHFEVYKDDQLVDPEIIIANLS